MRTGAVCGGDVDGEIVDDFFHEHHPSAGVNGSAVLFEGFQSTLSTCCPHIPGIHGPSWLSGHRLFAVEVAPIWALIGVRVGVRHVVVERLGQVGFEHH